MAEKWVCHNCGGANPASRTTCIGCNSPRITDPEELASLERQRAERQRPYMNPSATLIDANPAQRYQYKMGFFFVNRGGPSIKVDESTYSGKDVPGILDDLGSKGWELVSASPHVVSESAGVARNIAAMDPVIETVTSGYYLWFKRVMPPGQLAQAT